MTVARFEPRTEVELGTWLGALPPGNSPGHEGASFSLRHFVQLGPIDPMNLTVAVDAGVRMVELVRWLESSPAWLGPLGPFDEAETLGGFLQGRGSGAGLRVAPAGRLEPLALSVRAVLRDGSVYSSREAPRSAGGPELDALLRGGGYRVGVVVRATLRLMERPKHRRKIAFAFQDAFAAVGWLVRVLAEGCRIDHGQLHEGFVSLELYGNALSLERDLQTTVHRAQEMGGQAVTTGGRPMPNPGSGRLHGRTWPAIAQAAKETPQSWHRAAVEGAWVFSDSAPNVGEGFRGGNASGDAWAWIHTELHRDAP